MPRMPYADLTKVPDHVRTATENAPYNVTRMLAGLAQPVYDGFAQFSNAMLRHAEIPPDLREIAILRAGYIAKARYETFQHEALARHVGLSDKQIEAIKAGGKHPGILTPMQQAVLDFADDIIVNVRASDATLAAVRAHFPDHVVMALILVTGLYMTVSRFLETTGVELDKDPIDWNVWSGQSK